jgi:hypothetical protein
LAIAVSGIEEDIGLLDLEVHTCGFLPDLDRLILRQFVAQAMPGCFPDKGHVFR